MYEKVTTDDGEKWKWAGAIRSVDHGKAWIAKRDKPENWKVEARGVVAND